MFCLLFGLSDSCSDFAEDIWMSVEYRVIVITFTESWALFCKTIIILDTELFL